MQRNSLMKTKSCGVIAAIAALSCARVCAQASVPYTYRNVVVGGTGVLTGFTIHPRDHNAVYLRGDGGAYRWDANSGGWISVSDGLPNGGAGVEAFAVDPNDASANTLYCAAPSGNGNFHISTDRGNSWTNVTVTDSSGNAVYVSGNDNGKSCNNRVQVDPNNSQVLYWATRRNGLFWSTNGGQNWSRFSAFTPVGDGTNGVSFIALDGGSGTVSNNGTTVTGTMYVGVWGSSGSNDNGVYRSTDGGQHWTRLGGASLGGVWQGMIAPGGTLYVTHTSGVAKIGRGGSGLADITPGGYSGNSFAALAVDPTDSSGNTVVAGQFGTWSGLAVLRTTNGGANWAGINGSHTGLMPWVDQSRFSDWTQCLAIDPANPKLVWLGDGDSAWQCADVTAQTPAWTAQWKGEEAMTVFGTYSPPSGAPLFIGAYDPAGFRVTDITQAPSAANHFGNQADVESMDYCEANPNFVAYTITGTPSYSGATGGIGLSSDNGQTWPRGVGLSSPDGTYYGGKVAVGATVKSNGSPNVVHLLEKTTSGGVAARYSTDWGQTWGNATGLPAQLGDQGWDFCPLLAADRVDGNKFYAFQRWPVSVNGSYVIPIYRSTDGGATWGQCGQIPYNYWTGHWGAYKGTIFAEPGRNGTVWVSLYDGNNPTAGDSGLFRSTDSGSTWTRIANVKYSRGFAIGKGTSASASTLYVFGTITINGTDKTGLFRSDTLAGTTGDGSGASWTQIYDPNTDATAKQAMNMEVNIGADRQTYGRVYFTTFGRGTWVGDPVGAGSGPYSGTPVSLPGTIEAENYDTGGEGVGYHETINGYQSGYRSDNNSGIYGETAASNGYGVGWTGGGQWLRYTVNVQNAGVYNLISRVSSGASGGTFHVEDENGANLTGTITAPATGGWSTYTTVTKTGVSLPAGRHTLRVVEDSGGYNLDSFQFQPSYAGTLTVSGQAITSAMNVNLTQDGPSDWAHWGLGGTWAFDHKANVTQLISNFSQIGSGSIYNYTGNLATFTWSDGTPTASANATDTGVFTAGAGNGFAVDIAAGTAAKSLKLYVGGWNSLATLTAHLSDDTSRAVDQTDVSFGSSRPGNTDGAHYYAVYTITFQAAANNQTLHLTWTASSVSDPTWGNVSLQAISDPPLAPSSTLSAPTGVTATAGASGSKTITLRWTGSALAASYNVYRSTGTGAVGTTPYKTGLKWPSFTDTGLTAGTKYNYKVAAVNAKGTGAQSAAASATAP